MTRAALATMVLLVGACGGGGGGGNDSSGSSGGSTTAGAVPASAGDSWPAMLAFMGTMVTDESSEPLAIDAITNPPREESAEPSPVS